MKKFFFFCLSLAFSTPALWAQAQISGSVTYQSMSKAPFEFNNSRMDPEQRKMIEARIAKAMQKQYELSFNRNEALYREIEELEKEEERGMRFMSMMTGSGGLVYKNLSEALYLNQTEFFGKKFLITDSLEQLPWQFSKETKSIGKYLCQKATAQRVVTISKMEQNEQGERESSLHEDTVTITAWYTMQVPVAHGPDRYSGLPGLIMELNDGVTTFLASKVSLKTQEALEIDRPSGGEVVSREEYKELTIKKMEEMRRMYGNQGRGTGSGSMQMRIGG